MRLSKLINNLFYIIGIYIIFNIFNEFVTVDKITTFGIINIF